MPSLKANHRQILAAEAIAGKRTRYRIEGVPGLWLSICPTGKRTWYVRYQPGGRSARVFRQYTIGDAKTVGLATATRAAHDVVNKVKVHDLDPVAERIEKKRETLTFGDLFEDWYDRHAKPKLARHLTDRAYYDRHLKPEFGSKRISELKRTEIARSRDKIAAKATPLVSNEALMLLNRVLNWALDEGMLDANPAARLRRAGKSKPRERVLPPSDIRKLWSALDSMESMTGDRMARAEKGRMLSPATRSILRLLLLTGQRRSEVAEAQKCELQFDGPQPVWTIPGNRTKNGLLHRLPLCPMAAEEFRRAVQASHPKSQFVFPSGEVPLLSAITPMAVTRAMARLVTELKIAKVSPHDLRRTVGTEMARLGVPVHVRSLVLNHSPSSRGVTEAVYNRYAYDKEKCEALTAWEAEVAVLIAVPMTGAGGDAVRGRAATGGKPVAVLYESRSTAQLRGCSHSASRSRSESLKLDGFHLRSIATMPIDYARALFNISDDELERFVADWLASKMVPYSGGHERFSGAGDMGRDVVGYCTVRRFDDDWHNYQCKQLKKPLGAPEFFCELGKVFFHSASGAFPLPARMFFVAPRGVVRTVRNHIARPSTLAPALIAEWDKYCAEEIEDGQTHPLSPALRAAIEQYDFSTAEILDADKLVRFPEIKPVLVKWFDEDPGDYTTMPAPADLQDHEANYVTDLLAAYSERSGTVFAAAADALAHPSHGRHLRDQRTRYFDASAFSRYYRDNTPPGTVEDFQQQIYHGVVDESRLVTSNDALDRVDRVLKHASTLKPAGRLGKYARITVKQGTCHHLVNARELRWKE